MISERFELGDSGPGRKSFGDVVRLELDVADASPDADAVNQALRFLLGRPPTH